VHPFRVIVDIRIQSEGAILSGTGDEMVSFLEHCMVVLPESGCTDPQLVKLEFKLLMDATETLNLALLPDTCSTT